MAYEPPNGWRPDPRSPVPPEIHRDDVRHGAGGPGARDLPGKSGETACEGVLSGALSPLGLQVIYQGYFTTPIRRAVIPTMNPATRPRISHGDSVLRLKKVANS